MTIKVINWCSEAVEIPPCARNHEVFRRKKKIVQKIYAAHEDQLRSAARVVLRRN